MMGTRLKNLKSKTKALPDSTPLEGRNRLADDPTITFYYDLATRRNSESVKDMKEPTWAQHFHVMTSNEHHKIMHCVHEMKQLGANSTSQNLTKIMIIQNTIICL